MTDGTTHNEFCHQYHSRTHAECRTSRYGDGKPGRAEDWIMSHARHTAFCAARIPGFMCDCGLIALYRAIERARTVENDLEALHKLRSEVDALLARIEQRGVDPGMMFAANSHISEGFMSTVLAIKKLRDQQAKN